MELTAQYIAKNKVVLAGIIPAIKELVLGYVTDIGMDMTARSIARKNLTLPTLIFVIKKLV
jgi:hypothetical protein